VFDSCYVSPPRPLAVPSFALQPRDLVGLGRALGDGLACDQQGDPADDRPDQRGDEAPQEAVAAPCGCGESRGDGAAEPRGERRVWMVGSVIISSAP